MNKESALEKIFYEIILTEIYIFEKIQILFTDTHFSVILVNTFPTICYYVCK